MLYARVKLICGTLEMLDTTTPLACSAITPIQTNGICVYGHLNMNKQ